MTPALIPLSEDFLYWDPEEICRYPQPPGLEDTWFRQQAPARRGDPTREQEP